MPIKKHAPIAVVTGGAGYIGSIVCRKLLESGWWVRAIDNLTHGSRSIDYLQGFPRFDLYQGDIRQAREVNFCLSPEVNAVIHLASISDEVNCNRRPAQAIQVNYESTMAIAECCRQMAIPQFIFPSSCCVYGMNPENNLLHETDECHPASLFSNIKLETERALLELADARFKPKILRLATAFGISYRPRFDLVINSWVAEALRNQRITLFSPESSRPYLHVSDIADIMIWCLGDEGNCFSSRVMNIGCTSMNTTRRDLAVQMQSILPGTQLVEVQAPRDSPSLRVDFGAFEQIAHFKPSISLKAGMLEMVQALRSGVLLDTGLLSQNFRQA